VTTTIVPDRWGRNLSTVDVVPSVDPGREQEKSHNRAIHIRGPPSGEEMRCRASLNESHL